MLLTIPACVLTCPPLSLKTNGEVGDLRIYLQFVFSLQVLVKERSIPDCSLTVHRAETPTCVLPRVQNNKPAKWLH